MYIIKSQEGKKQDTRQKVTPSEQGEQRWWRSKLAREKKEDEQAKNFRNMIHLVIGFGCNKHIGFRFVVYVSEIEIGITDGI